MTKQEGIIRGMLQVICDTANSEKYVTANELVRFLHSRGVVIKVDNEYFPTILCPNCSGLITADVPKKAGYVAVEPLIKEL